MPNPEESGFIPTLNQNGYMVSYMDKFMNAFVQFAGNSDYPCVDIGSAYGIATIEALKRGGKMIANDLDYRHLQILKDKVPAQMQANLQLFPGRFPDIHFESNSLGALLLARIAHFLTPTELMEGASKMYDWLIPNGKVFLTAETPYLGLWESFIPIYEKRKAEGNIWAGQIENISEYTNKRGKQLPNQMLLLDPDSLRFVFEKAGFKIDVVEFLPRPEFPDDIKLDNRESVGLICTK